jgi:hypothetical protein
MTADAAPEAIDIELVRVLHAALGALLKNNGVEVETGKLLHSPEEAAVRLGLESTNQLYRRTSDGTWPCTPIAGLLKFSEADLEQIVKIQAREAVRKSSREALRAA